MKINALKKSRELGSERLFLGSENEIPQLSMRDRLGKERVKIFIDSTDIAKLQFFNENGKLVGEFPDDK
ncbi:hypothetical protein [Changchengzhania lutea]|uniref:hypothetical protein n=1 Tax=Changchengzhania lutea TaxID=2049305 RepID=UPI00115C51A0|nr:hypothetical protein [Changchengzhania lutea]